MRSLVLNITTFCNVKCPFCIVYGSLNRPELNMSDEQIFSTLENARTEGATEVGYSGGEPSVHKRIIEVVAYARELGYTRQSMNTNGIRFKDPKFCEEILDAGLNSIDFSIHGHDAELHDREVARPGAFAAVERACANLRALKDRFDFDMSATTVITQHNHTNLLPIVQKLHELGFENKRLKYAYEGSLTHQQVIDEVAPYEQVVPSLLEAVEYLAGLPFGFHFTHVPFCIMGDAAALSSDFTRRPAIMAFRRETYEGDAAHFFRKDADECSKCVVNNFCTRLDGGYERFHGRPTLHAFQSHDEVEAMFDRAMEKYPLPKNIIAFTRSQYREHRDAAAVQTVARVPVYSEEHDDEPTEHRPDVRAVAADGSSVTEQAAQEQAVPEQAAQEQAVQEQVVADVEA